MCWSKKLKTEHGLKIDAHKVPGLPGKDTYEKALNVLIAECLRLTNMDIRAIRKALGKTTIQWWDAIAPRPSNGELDTVVVENGMVYSGLTCGNTCKVAWRGKLYRSAFCHELIHVIARMTWGDPDACHENDVLWQTLAGAVKERLATEDL